MNQYQDTVEFGDPDIQPQSGFDPNDKTESFRPEAGKKYQITVESLTLVRRGRHYGRRYEQKPDERPEDLTERDSLSGAVVLPDPQANRPTVYRPATAGKELRGYRRCLAYMGWCPVCQSSKTGLPRSDNRRVSPAAEAFGMNVFVWKTDARGNLLGGSTGRPVDAEGKVIVLDQKGEWDQESYDPSGQVDEPTGRAFFFSINATVFSRFSAVKNETKRGGPLTHLNIVLAVEDEQFKDYSLTPKLHAMSAANFFRPKIDQEFKRRGIRKLGEFIVRELNARELVYFYGLESHLLKKAAEVSGDAPPPDLSSRQPSAAKAQPAAAQAPAKTSPTTSTQSRPAAAQQRRPPPDASPAPAPAREPGSDDELPFDAQTQAQAQAQVKPRAAVNSVTRSATRAAPSVSVPPDDHPAGSIPLDKVAAALEEL